MEFIILIVLVVVIAAIAKGTNKPTSKSARAQPRTRKPEPSVTITATTDMGGGDWAAERREFQRKAFKEIVDPLPDLPDSVKKSMWRECRKNFWPNDQFLTIIGSRDWQWPWLESAARRFKAEGVKPEGVVAGIINGPPRAPDAIEDILPHLPVAAMRHFLKHTDRYPKPAPRKRVEFETILRGLDWSDTREFAQQQFEELRPKMEEDYRGTKVLVLVQTLAALRGSYESLTYDRRRETFWVCLPERNVVAAREAHAFNKRQKPPAPPFYPGDSSSIAVAFRDVRAECKQRLAEAGSNPDFRVFWLNAQEATKNHDFPEARKWFTKAGTAIFSEEGIEDEKQRLRDDAAELFSRDPAYIIVLHELRQIIGEEPGILQKDIYARLEFNRDEVGQVLYFSEENRDVIREKAGNTYKLYLPEQLDRRGGMNDGN